MVCQSFSRLHFRVSPAFPCEVLPIIALQNNSPSTRPLVSQGVYFNPAGRAEMLLSTKPVKSSEAVTPLRSEEKSALQEIIYCIK